MTALMCLFNRVNVWCLKMWFPSSQCFRFVFFCLFFFPFNSCFCKRRYQHGATGVSNSPPLIFRWNFHFRGFREMPSTSSCLRYGFLLCARTSTHQHTTQNLVLIHGSRHSESGIRLELLPLQNKTKKYIYKYKWIFVKFV